MNPYVRWLLARPKYDDFLSEHKGRYTFDEEGFKAARASWRLMKPRRNRG